MHLLLDFSQFCRKMANLGFLACPAENTFPLLDDVLNVEIYQENSNLELYILLYFGKDLNNPEECLPLLRLVSTNFGKKSDFWYQKMLKDRVFGQEMHDYMVYIVIIHCQEEGCIGKYAPEAISRADSRQCIAILFSRAGVYWKLPFKQPGCIDST